MEYIKAQVNQRLQDPRWYCFSVFVRFILVLTFLYFFLVALSVMGDSFKAVGGKNSGSLFAFVSNPIAGLMVGILSTVLVQSSSTTTAIVVAAVGSNILQVQEAVPIIMGVNIGTSVTNTIVSLGFANEVESYERAFAGASIHDMFNFLGVVVFLPLDIIVNGINGGNGGFFFLLTDAMLPAESAGNDDLGADLGIKIIVSSISKSIIDINKNIINDYAQGRPELESCGTIGAGGATFTSYTMEEKTACGDPLIPNPEMAASYGAYVLTNNGFNCNCKNVFNDTGLALLASQASGEATLPSGTSYVGFASMASALDDSSCVGGGFTYDFCSSYSDSALAADFGPGINSSIYNARVLESVQFFFDNARTVKGGGLFDSGLSDSAIGGVGLLISLILLITCLVAIVKIMQSLVKGPARKWIIGALNYDTPLGGYFSIFMGAGITLAVQSSSITTSILTPLVAIDILTLKNMYPFTVGANLGTAGTALLAGFADGGRNSIQIALCHTFFNICNALVWYPAPILRKQPLNAALFLGKMAAGFRLFPVVYVGVAFVAYPLYFLGVSVLLDSSDGGQVAGGVILIVIFLAAHLGALFWYQKRNGKEWLDKKIAENIEANRSKSLVGTAFMKKSSSKDKLAMRKADDDLL